jgi:hypothetical protein
MTPTGPRFDGRRQARDEPPRAPRPAPARQEALF